MKLSLFFSVLPALASAAGAMCALGGGTTGGSTSCVAAAACPDDTPYCCKQQAKNSPTWTQGCTTKKQCDSLVAGSKGGASCTGSGCFPGDSMVTLKGGEKKRMSDVAIGDNVYVGGDEYSEVYYFSTNMAESDIDSSFLVLTTTETALTLTDSHFLYLNGELAEAGTAAVGDRVTLANGDFVNITNVAKTRAAGLFNPHTMNGDIVVDGVLTSTYTAAVHPTLAHALLSPLRILYAYGHTSFGSKFSAATKGLPVWVMDFLGAQTTPLAL